MHNNHAYSELRWCQPRRSEPRQKMTEAHRLISETLHRRGEHHISVGEPLIWEDAPDSVMWMAIVGDIEVEDHRCPEPILGVLRGEAHPYDARARILFASFDGRVGLVSSPYRAAVDVKPLRDARSRGYLQSRFMRRHAQN